MEAARRRVVIIGGGFSGTLVAVNLARAARDPLDVALVTAEAIPGQGVAYGTRRPEHLLNVVARNMSAFPDLPDHFVRWLRTRGDFDQVPDAELRERFVPRRVYGDYLRSLLTQYLEPPGRPAHLSFELVEGTAVDIEPAGRKAVVRLADGRGLPADRIVLATGNEPPADLPGSADLDGHPAWVGNAWERWHEHLPPAGSTIILLGTGLTTVDAIITLTRLGWEGQVHAVSRHGWLPQPHFRSFDYADFPPATPSPETLGLAGLAASFEEHCCRLRDRGLNPALLVDRLRPHMQQIWQRFSVAEKRAFAREHAARWNVHRHRIAPEIHAQVMAAVRSGRLTVHAATIERLERDGDRIRVALSRGDSLAGDLVVNATGPQLRFSKSGSPLLCRLRDRGLVVTDEVDMGIRVEQDHSVVPVAGHLLGLLFALGPLLRGTLWETTAVPELRGQARRVADAVLGTTYEPVVEPFITEYTI